ncbi:MAG: hypothetical protein M3256_07040 [Actinomycetota bacterium]|nr:hypothetical protein [Actinomycetota bacterium]
MVDDGSVELVRLTDDPAGCRELVDHLRHQGQRLWVMGYIVGPDRAAGLSPGGYGDDGTVALGLVAQMAAELGAGALTLLEVDNRYAAAALIRQLVELEYLSWWMTENPGERCRWIRASVDERRTLFSPAALRKMAGGRFTSGPYHAHCGMGGHPDPRARLLLPDHKPAVETDALVGDLLHHLGRVRRFVEEDGS